MRKATIRKLSLGPRETRTGLWPKLRSSKILAWRRCGRVPLTQTRKYTDWGRPCSRRRHTPGPGPWRPRSHSKDWEGRRRQTDVLKGPHRPVPQDHQSAQMVGVSYNVHTPHLKGPVLGGEMEGVGGQRKGDKQPEATPMGHMHSGGDHFPGRRQTGIYMSSSRV